MPIYFFKKNALRSLCRSWKTLSSVPLTIVALASSAASILTLSSPVSCSVQRSKWTLVTSSSTWHLRTGNATSPCSALNGERWSLWLLEMLWHWGVTQCFLSSCLLLLCHSWPVMPARQLNLCRLTFFSFFAVKHQLKLSFGVLQLTNRLLSLFYPFFLWFTVS